MNKSQYVALKNRYPGGRVIANDSAIDAFCAGGKHRVALRKNGNGDWFDASAELGCEDELDLSAIPKECRVYKLDKAGNLVKDDQAADRKPKAEKLAAKNGGRVPAIAELLGKLPSHKEVDEFRLPEESKPAPAPAPQAPAVAQPSADQSAPSA